MGDGAVAQFVANSVITERGATDRLAQAFQALVPDVDRQRQLLSLAEDEVAGSELGQEAAFQDAVEEVEDDADVVLGREVRLRRSTPRSCRGARTRAMDVEAVSDDPPERIAAWLDTVTDARAAQPRSPAAARPAVDRSGRRRAGATSPRPSPRTPRTWSASAISIRRWQLADAVGREGQRSRRGNAARAPRARAARARHDDPACREPARHGRRARTSASRGCATRIGPPVIPRARRSPVGRAGRPLAPPAARHPGRVRRRRGASRSSS